MKRIFAVIAILAVIVAFYFILRDNGNDEEETPEFTRITPERGDILKMVAASGSVMSNLDVEIKCKASGEIVSLPFDIGDSVDEGDLLVKLDPEDEERNIELAKINLYQSQARLNKSRKNLEVSESDLETARDRTDIDIEVAQARLKETEDRIARVEELYERGFTSQEEYEAAMTELTVTKAEVEALLVQLESLVIDEESLEMLRQDVDVASADVRSSLISLDSAEQRLEDTKVYSPMDGIVTARFVQTGQIISSGISNMTGGTPVMMVSDLSRLFVYASVDESDIGSVEAGQRVEITVDAFPDDRFSGGVVRISPVGENVSNVVTFEVRIEVTSDNKGLLMPEMTADAEIVTGERKDVLRVPSNAVTRMNGGAFVMAPGKDGEPMQREVVTGLDDGQFVEIVDGLSENDVVFVQQGEGASMWRRSDDNHPRPPIGMMGVGRRR